MFLKHRMQYNSVCYRDCKKAIRIPMNLSRISWTAASHVSFHDLKIVHLGHSEDHSHEGFPVGSLHSLWKSLLSQAFCQTFQFWLFHSVFIVFHQLLLPFWSLHFLFFVVCEFFRIWLNTNVHRVFTMSYQQSLCRFAPGGSPKHPPRQPTGATRFSKHALTNRWMAQFPGAEGQEPKKGEGSWWKVAIHSYTAIVYHLYSISQISFVVYHLRLRPTGSVWCRCMVSS